MFRVLLYVEGAEFETEMNRKRFAVPEKFKGRGVFAARFVLKSMISTFTLFIALFLI
jgi:hypothetical protein